LDLHLAGKVALVIASSKGLGKAIATQLAMEGSDVMLTSRDAEQLAIAREQILRDARGRVESCPCDITKADEIEALVAVTRERLGPINILINNAGGPPGGGFDQVDDAAWQAAFELNLLSYVRLIRNVLPDLKEKGGRIINVTSASIKQPIPGLILSNVFRMGILGLAKTLADELAPYNILVNTVAPGRIATDRTAYLDEFNAKKRGITKDQVAAEALQRIPLKRYGDAEEFAKVVCFLASGSSSYVTGSTITVDGGMVRSY
jgi:3-oxoacyl-[acyl-carrier protein] reductase